MNNRFLQQQQQQQQQQQNSHNLNIQSYTLDEIFGLFHIPPRSRFTLDDLKQMKRQVLFTHPDKSRFPPEYFIFYKKAFEVMAQYYEANCKFYDVPCDNEKPQKQEEPHYPGYTGSSCTRGGPKVSGSNNIHNSQPTKAPRHDSATRARAYDPLDPHSASEEQIRAAMRSMPDGAFQRQFNQLYEQNIVDHAAQQRTKKFGWFSDASSDLQVPQNVSKSNFDDSLEQVRKSSALVRRSNQAPSSYNVVGGAADLYDNIHDNDGDNEDEDAENPYITCDPFSKLKFDDLRKVHKDQTVFAVSDRDFRPEQKHQSVDMFNREWSKAGTVTPYERSQAEHMIREQERIRQERLSNKQYLAAQRTMEYEEKNKQMLANFLRLT